MCQRLKKTRGEEVGVNEGGGNAAVDVCGLRKSKKSSPNDSCKSSADERKSLLGEKKCAERRDEYTHNAFILQIQYKCSVYIISGSYRIIDIVCVCLHQCTCHDYKTVNSSTDSTV